MTLVGFVWTAFPCLLIGAVAGWRAASRYAVRERQADPARQPGSVRDVGPTEFSAFWDGR